MARISRLQVYRARLRTAIVEFEPRKTPGFAIVTLQQALSTLMSCRTIDLRTPHELSRYIRDRVIAEALVLCVQP
ncbi:hypothetical protein [Phormidesmis priestleyi]